MQQCVEDAWQNTGATCAGTSRLTSSSCGLTTEADAAGVPPSTVRAHLLAATVAAQRKLLPARERRMPTPCATGHAHLVLSRCNAQRRLDPRRVVECAALHHQPDTANILDTQRGIAVDQDEIRLLARRDHTALAIDTHHLG